MPLVASLLRGALLLPAAYPCLHAQNREARLTIFAASSLTEAFREIGTEFTKREPGVTPRFNFAGSQQLASQIELAGGADVFASADERWMDVVEKKSLVAGDPAPFARNALVVVLPAANPGNIDALQDLARPGLRLVLAAPSVPAGRYAREVLEKLAAQPGFPRDFTRRVLANVVSNEESVRGVLGKVLLGEADGGMVYRSDLAPSGSGRLRRIEIPEPANVTAPYLIAILRESDDPSLARRFVAFVLSPPGRAILGRHGFLRAER